MSEVSYAAAIQEKLNGVLHGQVLQGVLSGQEAQLIANNIAAWQHLFISQLGNRSMSDEDFTSMLSKFIYTNGRNIAMKLGGNRVYQPQYQTQQPMYSPPPMYTHSPQQMVPIGNMSMGMGGVDTGQFGANVYAAEPVHPASIAAERMINEMQKNPTIRVPEKKAIVALPEGFCPAWVNAQQTTENVVIQNNSLSIFKYPKSEFESGFTYLKLGCNESKDYGDELDCAAIVRRLLSDTADPIVAIVKSRDGMVIRNVDVDKLNQILAEIKSHHGRASKGTCASEVLDDFLVVLEEYPRNIYAQIERLLVQWTNDYLQSYRLNGDHSVTGVDVSISAIEHLNVLNLKCDSVNHADVAKLTNQQGYGSAFDDLAMNLLIKLTGLRIAESEEDLRTVVKAIRGITGFGFEQEIGKDTFKEAMGKYGVGLTYPVWYAFTTYGVEDIGGARYLNPDKSKKQYSRVIEHKAGNFDHIITDNNLKRNVLLVRDLMTAKPFLRIGLTLRGSITYRLV